MADRSFLNRGGAFDLFSHSTFCLLFTSILLCVSDVVMNL